MLELNFLPVGRSGEFIQTGDAGFIHDCVQATCFIFQENEWKQASKTRRSLQSICPAGMTPFNIVIKP
jgi:hypothetical protein